VNKKILLITAAVGVVGFLGAFATGWLTRPTAAEGASPEDQANGTAQTQMAGGMTPRILSPSSTAADNSANTRSLTEDQLEELVFEVREKIDEYNKKLAALEKGEERLKIAQQTLKKDVEALNNLRVDLAATAANLKNERDMLIKTRVEVEQAEKGNLVAIAAAYDRMDAARAGEILTNMAMGQSQKGVERSANIDDAVKILYYMQERTKAKVLAELVMAEPGLAAMLSRKLKLVTEGN
jgi:flagellar motility protein MotE (MotC chaperone)